MIFRDSKSGFTLLELLISITLMAVIVTILSMAVRAGLRAWERGQEANDTLIRESSIENLLSRQLKVAIRTSSQDFHGFAMFKGDNAEISFVTTYAPLGSQMGGIFWVIYRYDAETNKLIYAQRIITRKEDLNDPQPEQFKEESINKGWVYSEVSDVRPMIFFYCIDHNEASNPKNWQDKWDKSSDTPQVVVLGWGAADAKKGEGAWSYRMLCTDPFCKGEEKR